MRRAMCVALAWVTVFGATSPAAAGSRARRRFEPTDLRLLEEGSAEIDVQGGIALGDQGTRAYAPDFEASVGISNYAEIEVDGAFGFENLTEPQFVDETLVALRLAVVDWPATSTSPARWSAGIQAGPRLPTLKGARGLGLEALVIAGRSGGRLHIFAQAGALVDSATPNDSGNLVRPVGVECGLDVDIDLDESESWSLKGELGGVKFLSADASQLQMTVGPAVSVASWLELSAVGIVGILPGGDRLGFLLGATSHFGLF